MLYACLKTHLKRAGEIEVVLKNLNITFEWLNIKWFFFEV